MIESMSNGHIKKIQKLMKNARFRRQEQAFVVEGWKMVEEALMQQLVKVVYLSADSQKDYKDRFAGRGELQSESEVEIQVISDKCIRQISELVTPQGVLAIVQMPKYDRKKILSDDNASVLCLEDIQDPGNLGTMMRTAEGAGMSALILSRGCVDLFNPKVVRATMGSLYRVPFFYCDEMSTEVERLKDEGFTLYAAHLEGTCDFTHEAYTGRVGILIGNEAKGLSDLVSEKTDHLVRIPMEGKLESLNAAVSASLFMYEVYRHRKNFF